MEILSSEWQKVLLGYIAENILTKREDGCTCSVNDVGSHTMLVLLCRDALLERREKGWGVIVVANHDESNMQVGTICSLSIR